MAVNNALGSPTAAKMRAKADGGRAGRSPSRSSRRNSSSDSARVQSADGFGAGATSVVDRSEVAGRGVGSAIRTPLEEFEARPGSEIRAFFTGVMFLTRLPCPGWCDHHPGYLMRAMAYFPLIGACVVGVWASSIYDAAASLWSPLIAAALSSGGTLWLTGCFHEDGLCDTLDGFGGGWTKSQILKIMRDSRNGSYATMGAGFWVVAKLVALAKLGEMAGPKGSVWALGASVGAGPAIVVAQGVARASAAPLIYTYAYIVDDEDAKGEYYNVRNTPTLESPCSCLTAPPGFRALLCFPCLAVQWFGDCRRLLGVWRVLIALVTAVAIAYSVLPPEAAARVLIAAGVGTIIAGQYGQSVLGGVMGDFLGATICILEVAIYLAICAETERADPSALTRLVVVLTLPQVYGLWRRRYDAETMPQEC
jgi:cobalamin synthase